MKKFKVLVAGQTPPPYYGQAIMIEKLVKAKFDSVEIIHLPMSFSGNVQEIGKWKWRKLFHLFNLLFRGIYLLIFRRIDVLYYPPAGPQWIPVLRDMALLSCWRMFAPNVVYHFRAGGVSDFLSSRPSWLKRFAQIVYGHPSGAIVLSRFNPKDAEFFRARQIFVVPNGIEDVFVEEQIARNPEEIRLFYIGLMMEEKGIYVLLEAFRKVVEEYKNVSLHLAGEFPSSTTKQKFIKRAQEFGIQDKMTFYGLVTLNAKWELFGKMDILCFLSHYPAESFGNSVLEAMMWELPVVATRWRAVQDLVIDQQTGFLVPIQNAEAAAEKIKILAGDPEMRIRFGKRGRERFVQEFTLEKHLQRMENAILCSSSPTFARVPANADQN
jgi:glycosyltransferase involved in cell wall biosynthesis